MESGKSPSPIPTPIQTTADKSGTKSKSKSKPRIPRPKSKKSKTQSPPAAAIIYVPVLVQSLPSESESEAQQSQQPAVLSQQQMKDWRCQADDCTAQAAAVGRYYQRHRICPEHSKAPSVLFHATHHRYCQQCSRFHDLAEFDGSRRSCRRQLCRRRLLRTLNTFSNPEEAHHHL